MQFVQQMARLIDEQTDMLWEAVDGFLATGSDAEDLAAALGISRPTLYRRLAAHREKISAQQ